MTADPHAALRAAIDLYEAATRPPPQLVDNVMRVVFEAVACMSGVVDRLTRRFRG